MAIHHSRLSLLLLTLFVGVAPLASCTDGGMEPKKELSQLAGVWDAKVLTVPDPVDISQEIDLIGDVSQFLKASYQRISRSGDIFQDLGGALSTHSVTLTRHQPNFHSLKICFNNMVIS